MEPLLTTFIAAFLAEWGDKTQLLVVALAAFYARPGPILAGVALAAALNAGIAASGGTLINGVITLRAISLLAAVALIFAGVGGLLPQKRPQPSPSRRWGAFLTAFATFFVYEFGDKTQFVTAALAAQFNSLVLAAAGSTAGVLVASAPAALLGRDFEQIVPVKPIRLAASILFLVAGLVIAVNARRLV